MLCLLSTLLPIISSLCSWPLRASGADLCVRGVGESVRESMMEDAEDSEWTYTANVDVTMGGASLALSLSRARAPTHTLSLVRARARSLFL